VLPATKLAGPTQEEVFSAVRCYVSAQRLLDKVESTRWR
jgi:hypothetical protein